MEPLASPQRVCREVQADRSRAGAPRCLPAVLGAGRQPAGASNERVGHLDCCRRDCASPSRRKPRTRLCHSGGRGSSLRFPQARMAPRFATCARFRVGAPRTQHVPNAQNSSASPLSALSSAHACARGAHAPAPPQVGVEPSLARSTGLGPVLVPVCLNAAGVDDRARSGSGRALGDRESSCGLGSEGAALSSTAVARRASTTRPEGSRARNSHQHPSHRRRMSTCVIVRE
jgi:hypothetical protein